MKNSSKYRATLLSILVILTFSTFTPTLVFAAPLGSNDKDWQNLNGNSWGWNYSPQTQINKDNVGDMEVKWIFPLGSKALAPAALQAATLGEGSSTPPIVRNGIAYVMTNFKRIYAIDAKTGQQKWSHDYLINITAARERLPVVISSISHFHGIRYWEGGDAILDIGAACDFYAVDAKTGKDKFQVLDLCKDVPGNLYKYGTMYNLPAMNQIGTYEKGRQFIIVQPGSMHSTLVGPDSRHVTMGISMDAPYNIIWRVFSSPPQDVLTKDWALEECGIGFFQGTIPCSDVAAKNRAGLEWDFGLPNEPPSKWGGVTANWGQMLVDEDTGFLYTQTGNQGPYSNMTYVPGPRLYGSTIMAIDMNAGKRAWWMQPFPHDPYDYDCNWNGILAETKVGKVYIKGCKEGILYAMDAKTGKSVWTTDVVTEQIAWGQITSAASKVIGSGGVKYYRPDPYSYYDMREWNWISYPARQPGEPGKYCTIPCTIYPYFGNGIFGTDMSYDPQTQTVFHYAVGLQFTLARENPYVQGGSLFTTPRYPIVNTTVVAKDANTGKTKWTWYYNAGQQRSHMIVTPGLMITGFTDGYIRALDSDNGKVLFEKNLGAAITVGPTMGKDTDGNTLIFVDVGTRLSNTPGSVVALGLSAKAAKVATVTTTSVSTTTATTTSTTTATTTSATTSTVTTTSATTSTVTTTSATTATTTLVSTQPAKTTTVTSEVTQTSGLPAEVTYAVAAVAVIAIIAAAVLVMRKK